MMETEHWVALETGPYFWKVDAIYNFLKETFNIIKPAVERIREAESEALGTTSKKKNKSKKAELTDDDKKLDEFVKKLSEESDKVFCGTKWVDIMGIHIFNILKRHANGTDTMKIDNDEAKKACVVQLLRLVRNKIEHILSYSDEVKQTLPMFFGGDEESQKLRFAERFVSYWIETFPRFIPFLWVKFFVFRDDIDDYYSVKSASKATGFSLMPINQPSDLHIDLSDIVKILNGALISHLEKGAVFKRFKLNEGLCSLEFRAIQGLSQILDKKDSISIQILPGNNLRMTVSHSKTQHKLNYVSTQYLLTEKTILIFTDDIELQDIWRDCEVNSCKLIVFSGELNLNENAISYALKNLKAKTIIKNLLEYPVTGNDLTVSRINDILKDAQVGIQNNNVKIKDIFTECTASEECKKFYGDFLNQLLRNQTPKLFSEYKFPPVDQIYVERSVNIRGRLGVKRGSLGTVTYNPGKWNSQNTYECIHTNTENVIADSLRKIGYENQKSFFIVAEPGGGKTQMLKSLGGKLIKGKECGLVIFTPMRKFVDFLDTEILEDKNLGIVDSIKKVIENILFCQDPDKALVCQDSEKNFLNIWLNQQNVSNKFGVITLMLDGLDEVPTSSKKLALDALEAIKNNMETIRLWVSSRLSFPAKHDEEKYDTVSILRFSENELKYFFLKYFQTHKPYSNAVELALQCSRLIKSEKENKLLTQIATTPLHCTMIAELYGQAFTSFAYSSKNDLSLKKSSLYEAILKKKIHVYMREKLNITIQANKSFFQTNEKILFELHMYLALEYTFPGKFIKPLNADIYTKSDYLEMGIVLCAERLTFVHKTFAEYLLARFVFNGLKSVVQKNDRFHSINELLVKLVITSRLSGDFKHDVTFNFLNEMLIHCSLEKMPFVNIPYIRHKDFENDDNFIFYLFDEKLFKNHPKVFMLIVRLWLQDCSKELYTKALQRAMSCNLKDFPLEIFVELCKVFNINYKGMTITDLLHYKIFESAIANYQHEIVKYLVQEMGCFPIETWSSISKMREKGGGALHIILDPQMMMSVYQQSVLLQRIQVMLELLNELAVNETVKERDSDGYTALMNLPLFSKFDFTNIRTFLVEKLGADVNALSPDGSSSLCLMRFIEEDWKFDLKDAEIYHSTVELFLNNGFDQIHSKSEKEGWTALGCAIHIFKSALQIKTLELFQTAGFTFNAKDKNGDTILHYCVDAIENAAFAVPLIIFGCDISIKNETDRCSFCLAMDLERIGMCKVLWRMMTFLKKKPCGVECQRKLEKIQEELETNKTDFLADEKDSNKEIIQLLEKHKSNFPLFSMSEYTDITGFVEKELGDVNTLLPDGRSALCLIVDSDFECRFDLNEAEKYHKTLEWFISRRFHKIGSKTKTEGWTALFCAVHVFRSKLQVKTLKLFHDAKFDFNAKDRKGNTILHYCVESVKNAAFAIPLIRLGCDLSVKNYKGQCPLCLSLDLKNFDMCEVFWKMMVHFEKESCGNECKAKLTKLMSDQVADQSIFFDDDENIIAQMREFWYVHEWLVKRI